MNKLSEKQNEIINHIDGAILVKAGPGSGKTRVLIERIKNLLLTTKRCKVLALTFSNLAAEEMKNRLEEDSAINDLVGNVNVGTIHSFCLDIVQNRGNLIGLSSDMVLFENNIERESILKDIFISDPKLYSILKKQEKPEVFLQKCLELISDQKKKFIFPDMCEMKEPFPQIYSEYNQVLQKQNALDFDDILFYAYSILSENPGVVRLYSSLYKYICVDEAQDLNFAQYEVIKALCGDDYNNIMMVGDENQSIYGFNGSDSKFMAQQFVKDFNPTIYWLNENFRSARAIVSFANRLAECDSNTNYVYEGELKVHSFENEKDEADYVCESIKNLIAKGHPDIEDKLSFDDFAVIARNKYILAKIEETLATQKIPCFYKKATSGIENESDYMKVFELSIRLLINPKDVVHLRELCKIGGFELEKVSDLRTGIDILQQVLDKSNYANILTALALLDPNNFLFGKALQKLEVDLSNDINDDDKYLIFNDIEQWKKHWKKYTGQIQRENRTLLSFRNYISLGKTQDVASDKGVALLTAHMSKGLQFETVFVIGLSEGTFPDYRAVKSGGADMEQEKNNMYVAVTRAKRLCYLSYSKMKMMPWGDTKRQEPSRFLRDLLNE